jgi:hypothetical protein
VSTQRCCRIKSKPVTSRSLACHCVPAVCMDAGQVQWRLLRYAATREFLKKGNNVTAPFPDTGNENIPRKKDRVQPCHTTAVVACMGEYTAHTQVRAANSGAFFFSRVRPYDIIASLSKTIVNVTKRYMEKTQFVLFCKNYSRGKMKQSLGMKGTLLSLSL